MYNCTCSEEHEMHLCSSTSGEDDDSMCMCCEYCTQRCNRKDEEEE